ncbi:hypothetical protein CLOM_g21503 [Closterium sp. NIES-68]|nr:hypothetical protein CLOM_g21503 [Closterium sp. NIES-68]GJP81154.1 hypothetical protein CLOP_g11324 [Closterium sp. NIES-67]
MAAVKSSTGVCLTRASQHNKQFANSRCQQGLAAAPTSAKVSWSSAVSQPLSIQQKIGTRQFEILKRPVTPRAISDSETFTDFCLDPEPNKSVLSVILGGGASARLYPLTKDRATPAVPLAANYRLIDIPVSNCLNSDIDRIYVLTQVNSASLNRHCFTAYAPCLNGYQSKGFVEVLAAQQSPDNPNWFQGTADAVRQYIWLLEDHNPQEYLILAGDQLYRFDYRRIIQCHRRAGADITVAAIPVDRERATSFGLMKVDDDGRVIEFAEKPQGAELDRMKVDTTSVGLDDREAAERPFIASMGIYVISRDALPRLLLEQFPDANDFGREVIPAACANGSKVQAYIYDGYWEDIGSIDAFYHANLRLTKPNPPFTFYDRSAPIFTQSRSLPPSKLNDVDIAGSVIGEGCILQECAIHDSVVGLRSIVGAGSSIHDSLLLGADYYENADELEKILASGRVPIGVGQNSVIKGAILDKNARIGDNVHIINKDGVQESAQEDAGFVINKGIVTVLRNATIPSGTII